MATPEAGRIFGPYEAVSIIGKGGMGEVWRARDPRLGRDVAIKVSAQQFSDRFEREARSIAALNHPNVCHLYDVGPNYLVMELVEGPTLAERIAEGPIPVEEALKIAKQIAEALEAAHEKGIVHRDLKPANVKIRPDGSVKVLDFGLAKSGVENETTSDSPTMLSVAGMILGTAGYMAPEQARGKNVDKRADIWAFGVVLYEMVTGQQLFEGETVSDTLAAVLTREPDWSRVTPKLHRLLHACLEKDPRLRLRDIGDFQRLIEEASGIGNPAQVSNLHYKIAIGALVVIGAALSFVHFREKTPEPPAPVRFEINAPDKATMQKFGISPDGKTVAFYAGDAAGKGGLWVRPLASTESRRIAETSPNPPEFFWSPDSRFILYNDGITGRDRIKLRKVDLSGGAPETLCEVSDYVVGGSVSRAGVVIFSSGASLWRVPLSGGVPAALTAIDSTRAETLHRGPVFLPDGKRFLYLITSSTPANTGIYVGSLDSRPESQSRQRLLATDYNAVLASSPESGATHLLYLREDALFAQAFDAEKARLRGEPVRLTDHVARFGNFGYFGASASGALVYRTGGEALASFYQAAWLDRQGVRVNASTKGDFNMLALSPDDGRLAIVRVDHSSGKSGQSDIWSLDLTRKTFTRLTFEGGTNPVWSPDGKLVAYTSSKAAGDGIYRRPSDGSGTEEELLAPGKARRIVNNWSRDGRFLLYSQSKSDTNYDLWLLPISPGVERKPALFLGTDRDEVQGQISPDSRWVAYVSDESGRPEVYVQPLPGTGGKGKWLVSNDGGLMPRWRRDGRELYYLQNQALTSVSIDAGGVFHAGEPHAITITPFRINSTPVFRWDVTADGKRFIGSSYADTEDTASTSPITVVLNWAAGLKR